jgi:ergothioneine biosynthesis protein EgtB
MTLVERYLATRARSEALCRPLALEDYGVQSMADASPPKWHLAHTTWFFETFILCEHARGYRVFDPAFHYLFNSYYDAEGARVDRAARGSLSRPRLEQVQAYRRAVDAAMLTLCAEKEDAVEGLVVLGLAHEEQHQELIVTDIKHLLCTQPTRPVYGAQTQPHLRAPPQRWRRFAGGVSSIGASAEGFAFDNERPRHRVFIEPFALASRPVTNSEYLDFIAAGGYRHAELWLSDGWAAAQAAGWHAPLYWEQNDSGYRMMTLAGMREVAPDEPVCHVSYYEADAYARFVGAALPTEAEWEHAATGQDPTRGRFLGAALQPQAAEGDGVAQLFGDVWEWTASAYAPYPDFVALPGALGEYNGKFMCNQQVLRGGSCATPPGHIRTSYRNFFPPQARWQFTGIRLRQRSAA